jgi:hypothetical protein
VNNTIEAAVDPFELGAGNGDPTQAFDLNGVGIAPTDVTLTVGNNPGIVRVCVSAGSAPPCTSLYGLFPGLNFIRTDGTADNRILGQHMIR